jgi:phage host-nuclease inhibitor protein Gam
MEAHLGKWATENRDALLQGSTKKSLSFVHGSIGWRRREGRLVVVDEAALKAWLTQQDDVTLFRVKVEPEMAALQQNYKAKGVIPPGMEFVATQEKLYIEPINLSSSMTRGNK